MKAIGATPPTDQAHLPPHRAPARRARSRARSARWASCSPTSSSRSSARRFYGISAGFHVDATTLAISLAVGLLGAAARRDARDPPCIAPLARRSAAGDRLGGRRPRSPRSRLCGTSASCHAAPRSACAARRGASAARSRPRYRSGSRSASCSARCRSAKAVANMTTRLLRHRPLRRLGADVRQQAVQRRRAARRSASIPGVREAQPLLTNNARRRGDHGAALRPLHAADVHAGPGRTGTGTATPRHARTLAWRSSARRSPTRRTSASATVSGSRHAAGPVSLRVIGINSNARPARRWSLPPARHAAVGPSKPRRDQQLLDQRHHPGPRHHRPDHHTGRGRPRRRRQPVDHHGALRPEA